MSMLDQVLERGFTGDGERDRLVRRLAELEDLMGKGDGSFPMDIEDELAEIRHYIERT